MIQTFASRETEIIWEGFKSSKLPHDIQNVARRKLRMLNNSTNMNDLMVPPSNRLEKLKGKLKDQYSIRINDHWRIVFRWDNGHSFDVQITDYH